MTDNKLSKHTHFRFPLFASTCLVALLLFAIIFVSSCRTTNDVAADPNANKSEFTIDAVLFTLFDGKTLGLWKHTDFYQPGEVLIKDGELHLTKGNDLTGLTWSGPVVRMDYEITLEAMRVEGSDFFCALTFPVDSNSCSLVLGGWGGTVCGISNLDYYDAANNETSSVMQFENGKWYKVRVKVVPGKIEAWVDDEQIVDVETEGRKIDTRFEVDMCKPLGLATWQTYGAIRNIWVRRLSLDPEPKL